MKYLWKRLMMFMANPVLVMIIGIQPGCREGLSAFKDHGFAFDWIKDARNWSAERMAAYPLVILTKSNHISSTDRGGWMTDDAQSAFADYVRSKWTALASIPHSGLSGDVCIANLLRRVHHHLNSVQLQ
jgi:hypothetical protein